MSGMAIALGEPKRSDIDFIMQKIAHRGDYASGIYQENRVIMAQNYLEADGAAEKGEIEVPLRTAGSSTLVICYDGQMGNWPELAREHDVIDGPFREERLILALYEKYGEGMLQYLTDAIFALAIFDGEKLFAARDMLGIKTLFYGWKDSTLYLASELKGILAVTGDVYEFPNGSYMNEEGRFRRFAELPESPPALNSSSVDDIARDIRVIIERSFNNRIDFSVPTGGLLSGGMDSSVINYIASKEYKQKFGQRSRLKTFALGVGESNDIISARIVSDFIDSEHHELLVDLEQMLEVLPEVIYFLESFDPSLVRSAVANYLISRYARNQGIQLLLSGEGGDEIFCGYKYLSNFTPDQMFTRQMECIRFLHNNASLRLDRMNMGNSVRVVAPLISGELLSDAMAIPPEYKMMPEDGIEKWIFRKAYEKLLPQSIVWRSKQEFSQGSGSAAVLTAYFDEHISDLELVEAQKEHPVVRSKEELSYFRLFIGHFGSQQAVQTVGQWISL